MKELTPLKKLFGVGGRGKQSKKKEIKKKFKFPSG